MYPIVIADTLRAMHKMSGTMQDEAVAGSLSHAMCRMPSPRVPSEYQANASPVNHCQSGHTHRILGLSLFPCRFDA